MDIKGKLREALEGKEITTLSVFDFDGTTMDTLEADSGKLIWKEKTGEDWPHKGWWGRIESLNMDVFDFKPKPEVMRDYKAQVANNNTMVVSLTGRLPKLGDSVKAVLDANGYKFDRYLYNYGGSTLPNKLEQMSKLLKEFPSIKVLNMWDDRNEHVPTFKQWGEELVKSGRLDDFNFTHVLNENWTK